LTDLNVTVHVFCDYNRAIILIFAVLRAMTQQSILHLVVNWKVFTINLYSGTTSFQAKCWYILQELMTPCCWLVVDRYIGVSTWNTCRNYHTSTAAI